MLSATLIRMVVATGVMWLLTAGGALIGPFVGVWFSMVAVQHAHVGIASTLMSLSPIILIPWVIGFSASGSARALLLGRWLLSRVRPPFF